MIGEIGELIEALAFDCTIETLQMTNALVTMKGRLSKKRTAIREAVEWFQALSPREKARFLLHRYVDDGYLACLAAWGKYDNTMKRMIIEALESIDANDHDAVEKTRRAIFAIKSKGVTVKKGERALCVSFPSIFVMVFF